MNKVFLLYSTFSNNCKKILQLLPHNNNINTLCIDNPKIRSQITKSPNFNIQLVPSIITLENNQYNLYQGSDATNFILNNYPQSHPPQTNIDQEPDNNIDQELNNDFDQEPSNGRTSLEDLFNMEDDEEDEIEETDEEENLMDKVERMQRMREDDS